MQQRTVYALTTSTPTIVGPVETKVLAVFETEAMAAEHLVRALITDKHLPGRYDLEPIDYYAPDEPSVPEPAVVLVDEVANLVALNRNGRHLDASTPGGQGDRETARAILNRVTLGGSPWELATNLDPEGLERAYRAEWSRVSDKPWENANGAAQRTVVALVERIVRAYLVDESDVV